MQRGPYFITYTFLNLSSAREPNKHPLGQLASLDSFIEDTISNNSFCSRKENNHWENISKILGGILYQKAGDGLCPTGEKKASWNTHTLSLSLSHTHTHTGFYPVNEQASQSHLEAFTCQ